jgi:lysophospholipase L1-like esterase
MTKNKIMSKRICIFGASTTHGAGDDESGGWVDRLKVFLAKEDIDNQVFNLGISGATSDMLLERMENEARPRRPDIIILALGSNDSSFRKKLGRSFVPTEDFKKNLGKIKKIANGFTDKIIFIGSTKVDEKKTVPMRRNTDVSYKNKDIIEYNQAIKEFCDKNNLPFIGTYDILNIGNLKDGLHPNSIGHEKIFQKVKDFLKNINLI